MGRRLFAVPLALAALALAGPGAARADGFARQDVSIAMDDGVALAASLYTPTSARPAAGYPAIIMFHGLGGTRADSNTIAEAAFANHGYEVLTFDARGHGQSGGLFGLDGPRELADTRALFAWLTARPDVDRAHVGAFGISLGGGAVWNAAVAGVPFAALEPVITWTDLAQALFPQDLAKSGLVVYLSQLVPAARTAPEISARLQDLVASRNLSALRAITAPRSSRPLLRRISAPTFMLQGRRDFLFDIDQAAAAYARLRGPKRLYLGDLGHQPAANPPAEQTFYLTECRLWFDRFLKGELNGIDKRLPVELASDPWNGRTRSYARLPATTPLSLTLPGATRIGPATKGVRTLQLPARALETFGAPIVMVSASTRTSWSHLVAVLTAVPPHGAETVVSEGGAATTVTRKPRDVTIRLLADAAVIPRGSRLRLTLAASSTAQDPKNTLYLQTPMPVGATVRLGRATVTLPVLSR